MNAEICCRKLLADEFTTETSLPNQRKQIVKSELWTKESKLSRKRNNWVAAKDSPVKFQIGNPCVTNLCTTRQIVAQAITEKKEHVRKSRTKAAQSLTRNTRQLTVVKTNWTRKESQMNSGNQRNPNLIALWLKSWIVREIYRSQSMAFSNWEKGPRLERQQVSGNQTKAWKCFVTA